MFEDKQEIERLLRGAPDGFGWRVYRMRDGAGKPITLARQAEHLHPGLLAFAAELVEVPADFHRVSAGFFANYWVLPIALFEDFMAYSLPVALKALAIDDHPYFRRQHATARVSREKCVGYLMERMFIFWYLKRRLKLGNVGDVRPVSHNL